MKKKKKIKLTTKQRHWLLGILVFIAYIVCRIFGINLLRELAEPIGMALTALVLQFFRVKVDDATQERLGKRAGEAILGAEEWGYEQVKKLKRSKPKSEEKFEVAVQRLKITNPHLSDEKARQLIIRYFPQFKQSITKEVWQK